MKLVAQRAGSVLLVLALALGGFQLLRGGQFVATVRLVHATTQTCADAIIATGEEPSVTEQAYCPQIVARASWFEATVKSVGSGGMHWVVNCRVNGFDQHGTRVFVGELHAGDYAGGLQLERGETITFTWYTAPTSKVPLQVNYQVPTGYARAPSSAVMFSADCPPVDYGESGPPIWDEGPPHWFYAS